MQFVTSSEYATDFERRLGAQQTARGGGVLRRAHNLDSRVAEGLVLERLFRCDPSDLYRGVGVVIVTIRGDRPRAMGV